MKRMNIPVPPGALKPEPLPASEQTKPDGRLTVDETHFIFASTLEPHHRSDPTIIAWIQSYIRCRSASQAAEEVGLDKRSGYNLRNRPDIHAAIVALTEKSLMKYGYDASEIVERVKEISQFDPIELERADGTWKKSFHEMRPEVRRVIKKLKVKNIYENDPNGMKVLKGEVVEYEFYDKMEAHKLLAQEKEVFKPKTVVEHDVSKRMADVLLDSVTRGAEKAIEVTARGVPEITGSVIDDAEGAAQG